MSSASEVGNEISAGFEDHEASMMALIRSLNLEVEGSEVDGLPRDIEDREASIMSSARGVEGSEEDGLPHDLENGGKKSQVGEIARILKITDFDLQLTTNEVDLLLSYSQHAAPNARKIKKLYNMYSMARLLLSKTMEENLSDDGGRTGKDKIIQV